MTRYLTLTEVLDLQGLVIGQSGGMQGIRDMSALESALAQPEMTFGGQELYPTLEEKAACLGFSLVKNHPFMDGNKRIGHAAMETFLVLNGYEIDASVNEQEADHPAVSGKCHRSFRIHRVGSRPFSKVGPTMRLILRLQ